MSGRALSLLAVGAIVYGGVLLALLAQLQRQQRLAARLRAVQALAGTAESELIRGGRAALLGAIVHVGQIVARSGLLSRRTLDELQQTLRVAGFKGPNGLGMFVGTKLLLLAGLPGLVLLVPPVLSMTLPYPVMMAGAAGVIGLLAPDFGVRSLRKRYLRDLERGLPDALDLLVICSEAGLGLEAAIERVSTEIRAAHPTVSQELTQTAREMQVNADRRAALLGMGARTGLESLRRLAATLSQSLQYGTPLSQALRTLSAEMRQELLTRFEARAARLPVLLTMPMIVFVLPCVFLIVAGPAMVQVLQTMRH